jgi:hypothetical protein
METTMELDNLKSAWQSLDSRLQLDNTLKLHELRERKLDRTRGSLRPLFWGQIVQMLFGVLFILLASLLWMSQPAHASSIVAGVEPSASASFVAAPPEPPLPLRLISISSASAGCELVVAPTVIALPVRRRIQVCSSGNE